MIALISAMLIMWPEEPKDLVIKQCFLSMAEKPNIRQLYTPLEVAEMCTCIMNTYEMTMGFDQFTEEFLSDNASKENLEMAGRISFNCARKTLNNRKELNSKDAI